MLAGGALGIAGVAVPMVEPGILASVIVLGLLVLAAARCRCGGGGPRSSPCSPSCMATRTAGAAGASRSGDLRCRLRARHGAAAWPGPRRRHLPQRRRPTSSCAVRAVAVAGVALVVVWRMPYDPRRDHHRQRPDRAQQGPQGYHADRCQYRRPADPGRLAPPFRRDQPGAQRSTGRRRAAPPRHRRRHRRALRARPDARGAPRRLRRQARGLRLPAGGDGRRWRRRRMLIASC